MPLQLPAAGDAAREVKVIGRMLVPTALKAPSTHSPKMPCALTVTPGSMVRVLVAATVTQPFKR